jgi:isoquinoline 1-oxidoreductase subunit beta
VKMMWLLADFVGDPGVARGAELPYRAAARRIGFDAVRLPVHTGPWRGLGAGPNGFAMESAIDECARVARADPVAFRLAHIEDARLARVLRRVAEASGWPTPMARADTAILRGRGVACGIYKASSYAAVVAEVEIDTRRSAGSAVRVTRLVCAHDCGRVINPDQVRAQCEGNLVWGLGMVLVESLAVANSQVAAATFTDAPIPRLADVPPIEVVLVDEGEAPSGAGETAIVAAGAAIANAVRAASGWRPTQLPLREDGLRAALARAR